MTLASCLILLRHRRHLSNVFLMKNWFERWISVKAGKSEILNGMQQRKKLFVDRT